MRFSVREVVERFEKETGRCCCLCSGQVAYTYWDCAVGRALYLLESLHISQLALRQGHYGTRSQPSLGALALSILMEAVVQVTKFDASIKLWIILVTTGPSKIGTWTIAVEWCPFQRHIGNLLGPMRASQSPPTPMLFRKRSGRTKPCMSYVLVDLFSAC